MGKFQLNKKGEDPIKIYEDTFKVAEGTVETHLGKLGKMPNPIAREHHKANEAYAEDIWDQLDDEQRHRVLDATNFSLKEFDSPLFALRSGIIASSSSELQDDSYESWSELADTIDGLYGSLFESKAKEVNGKYIINGMVIGKVTDFEPNNWFGKVELSEMPEFAEYGTLDPQAVVKGDDGVTYTDPKGGSDGSRGTLFNADGSPKPPTVSWGEVEAIAKEAVSEDEKDEMFQYLFDLQESGITNMFGSGPYVEREFPHLDKKEVRDVVMEWMSNYEAIHARMGIESKANERSIKQASHGICCRSTKIVRNFP